MKVLMLNGSPHNNGTTFRALTEVAKTIEKNGIETEILCVGNKIVQGCVGCSACKNTGKCVQPNNEVINEIVEKIKNSDGLVVGSPVYFAGINGTLKSILDRVFCVGGFSHKVAAGVVVARRAGTTESIDQLNKYFSLSNMVIATSQYWNNLFGGIAEQAEQDQEGLQTMRLLGDNISWIMKCIKAGEEKGIKIPEKEPRIKTNFYKSI